MANVTTNPNNPFVITLYEPTNVISSAAGGTSALSDSISALTTYINTDTASASLNTIGAYNASAIRITSDINLIDSSILYNGDNLLNSTTLNGTSALSLSVNNTDVINLIPGAVTVLGSLAVNGDITSTGDMYAANFFTPSDQRLKTNIRPYVPTGLPDPVRFAWTVNAAEDIGVLAQDAYRIDPSCVHIQPDGMQSVNYTKLVVLCIAEIKQLQQDVTDLKQAMQVLLATRPTSP